VGLHRKEQRFKLQEAELREKDILIQDNLIKFSTFLQQQEMRRVKDEELAQTEKRKIDKLEEEIGEKKQQLEIYKTKSMKIEKKVESMKKFEKFLEKVKDANPDEFPELIDILSRHKQLIAKNQELKRKQKEYADEHEKISRQLTQYETQMEMKKTLINNKMSKQKEQLEQIDKEKSVLLAQRDENTKQKSMRITETGQILMTVDNLYAKCELVPEIFRSAKSVRDTDFNVTHFDNSQESGKRAVIKLEVIIQCMKNFKELKERYLARQKEDLLKDKKKDVK